MNECAQSAGASDKGIPQDQERFQRSNDQFHEYAPKASGVVENQTAVPGHQEGGLLKKLLTTTTKKKDVVADQQVYKQTIQPTKAIKLKESIHIKRPMNGFMVGHFFFNFVSSIFL